MPVFVAQGDERRHAFCKRWHNRSCEDSLFYVYKYSLFKASLMQKSSVTLESVPILSRIFSCLRTELRKNIALFWVMGAFAALFVLDFLFFAAPSLYGVTDTKAVQVLTARYKWFFLKEQVVFLGCCLCVAMGFGLVAQALVKRWQRYRGNPAHTRRTILATLALAFAFHGWLYVKGMIQTPLLYTDFFYKPGGVRAWVMTGITNHLSPSLLDGALAGLVLAVFMVPMATKLYWNTLLSQLHKKSTRYALVMVGLVLCGVGGYRLFGFSTPRMAPASAHPSVLLLAVESLRAEQIPSVATPHLSTLAEQSVQFQKMFVSLPRTFSSWMSILTGRYPHNHGIRTMFPSKQEREQVGPALPQLLQEAGYTTQVFSEDAGDIFRRTPVGFQETHVPDFNARAVVNGFARRFHLFFYPYVNPNHSFVTNFISRLLNISRPDMLARQVIDSIKKQATTGAPFFFTVFLSTPHFPYASWWPYYKKFTDGVTGI